ncbi:TRAP-type C4-dicarboxylate transport system permease small subunit [Azorhizobium sp. AG788]|uniref:TRAP transporter small permease n=1 Tax=Azorhizobium sp. AG788 TaxID=2183897 RepID=UPI0010F1481A|nr:TRAP transporter small permease [Azorhizobium sp. AG788]TDT93792.1 TRAP-type C4-dicarboxylate transport system permease small subunit [Azorhizobium sp. AG788]
MTDQSLRGSATMGAMPIFVLLHRLVRGLSRIALYVSGLGLLLMTAVVFWQVIGRYVLNDSPSWTEPFALLLMSWFILLGAAVGVREGDHLGFEIGLHFAPPPVRRVMEIITHVLITGFGAAMAWYGWDLAMGTWSAKMAGVNLPQGVDYLPLVGGGGLIVLFSLERLLHDLVAPRVESVPLSAPHSVD